MSSPTNDKPNTVYYESKGDETNNHEQPTSVSTALAPSTNIDDLIQIEDSSNTCISEDQHITYLQTELNALNLSNEPKAEKNGSSFVQHHLHQPITTLQYQSPVPQIVSHVTNASYIIPNQLHGEKFSSIEAQPVLHSSGFTPPLVVYPPQYPYNNTGIVGGYPYNTGVIPLGFNGSVCVGSDVNTHNGTWGNGSQGVVDMQHMNRLYGPLGFAPPVVDPRMQFHPSYGDFYNGLGQIDPLGSDFASGFHEYIPQNQGVRGTFFTHTTNSALGGTDSGFTAVKNVSSPRSSRNWHGQRGFENLNHQKPFSYLEELKSGKGRRFELCDIVGQVVDFSVDQHGSRFIQQKLEKCSIEDKQSVFQEVLPHASKLMSDVFGNYVIQKFFEYGTADQRRDLGSALKGQMLELSMQMYGCRVIQKALDVIDVEQKTELVHELNGHVMRCVRDQNGNHVIQKCIECIPPQRIGFVITSFRGQVASLSMHPYGCRVIQRILERCAAELETQFIVDEILESVCSLAQDQYGNYVTQHVLEKGKPNERLQIIKNLCGKVVQMSQHKFASNVIEKCLDHGGTIGRELLIGEVIGHNDDNDNLLVMMKDQYANYVVQKILETCTDSQREMLIGRIAVHLHGLKKYTYGKHIVSRFEKIFGEMQAPSS